MNINVLMWGFVNITWNVRWNVSGILMEYTVCIYILYIYTLNYLKRVYIIGVYCGGE